MQYHLNGKGFSGRAVRVRTLDPMEVEDNLAAAAKLVSKEASVIELKKTEWRNGAKLMITEYTEPCEDPMALESKAWKKAQPGQFDDLGTYFTAKDIAVLQHIFCENHEVKESELDAIMGKGLPVSGA